MSASLRLGPPASSVGYGFIEIRNATIERLRILQAELGAASYDEVIGALVAGNPADGKPGHALCGVAYRWNGREITCRKKDRTHARSSDPGERAHVWWTREGIRVEWRGRP